MLAVVIAGGLAGLASIPHCVVMCGPLSLYAGQRTGARGAIHYQAGRLVSYGAIGAAVGAVGESVMPVLWGQGVGFVLALLIALVFVLAAYSLWPRGGASQRSSEQLVPIRKSAGTRKSLVERFLAVLPAHPFIVGASSGLLPCGALWSGVLLAVASGSLLGGVLSMIVFALASSPGTLLAPFLRSLLPAGRRQRKVFSLAMIAAAFIVMARPVFFGLSTPDDSAKATTEVSCPLHEGGSQ